MTDQVEQVKPEDCVKMGREMLLFAAMQPLAYQQEYLRTADLWFRMAQHLRNQEEVRDTTL